MAHDQTALSRSRRRVGARIRARRLLARLTPQDLADRLDVHVSSVWHWELGDWTPSLARFLELAHVLRCDLSDLAAPTKRRSHTANRRSKSSPAKTTKSA